MNQAETIIKQGQVQKPFESRVANIALRARVEKFQKILKEKRLKSRKVNVWKH